MEILKVLLTVVYILICVAIIVVVLMQEGKTNGLGALTGSTDTYWSKNKGRSAEGLLSRSTAIMAGIFIVLSLVLNMTIW